MSERRIVLGSLVNWLGFALHLAVAFLLTPYLTQRLGGAAYGVWAFVESVVAYFMLFDLGVAAAVVRYAARHLAEGRPDRLSRLASTALTLFALLGLISFVLGVAITPVLMPAMADSELPAWELRAFLWVMLANFAVNLPLSLFPALLDGAERVAAKGLWRVFTLVGRTLTIVAVTADSPSLWHLGLAFSLWTAIEAVGLVVLAYCFLPGLKLSARMCDRESLGVLKNYGVHAFVAMLAGRLSVHSGVLIAGFCVGAEEVTYYVVALRLIEMARALWRSATGPLTGPVSRWESRGEHGLIRKAFLTASRFGLYLMLPLQIGLWWLGGDFVRLWLGSAEIAEHATPALMILACTLAFGSVQSAAARVAYGTGRVRGFSRLALAEGVSGLALGVALVGPLGLAGVAWAHAGPNILAGLALAAWVGRILGATWRDWLGVIGRPALACSPVLVAALFWGGTANSWPELLARVLGCGLPSLLVAVALEYRGRRQASKPIESMTSSSSDPTSSNSESVTWAMTKMQPRGPAAARIQQVLNKSKAAKSMS